MKDYECPENGCGYMVLGLLVIYFLVGFAIGAGVMAISMMYRYWNYRLKQTV